MGKIFIIGTNHLSQKIGANISKIFDENKFSVVFREGVHGDLKRAFLQNPLLGSCITPWFAITAKFGKDFSTAEKEANSRNIPIINVDMSLNELIDAWKPLGRWFISPGVFAFASLFLPLGLPIRLMIAAPLAVSSHFGYFVYDTLKIRNAHWVEQIKKQFTKDSEGNALIVCGGMHVSDLAKRLNAADFNTTILS